ncbi:MAG: hypothetical protein D6726_03320 [Nitrospirae bacterium]|nr:MAG: hypothetical protein D6726_03320 [Nitrospirota bacterium]
MPEERERYAFVYENGRISLRAYSFRAEKGSVLHSGIFSRELASSFVAAAVAGATLIVFSLFGELGLLQYLIGALLFGVTIPIARIYIFKEPYLETTIDADSIIITLMRPVMPKTIRRNRTELRELRIEYKRFEPENPDAIEFVEKIALQHGTVIPGFGKVKEFYDLVLDFGDEHITILTTDEKARAEEVMVKLRDFLERGAKKGAKA